MLASHSLSLHDAVSLTSSRAKAHSFQRPLGRDTEALKSECLACYSWYSGMRACPRLYLLPSPCLEWSSEVWNTCTAFSKKLVFSIPLKMGQSDRKQILRKWKPQSCSCVHEISPVYLSLSTAEFALSLSLPAPVFPLCKGKIKSLENLTGHLLR